MRIALIAAVIGGLFAAGDAQACGCGKLGKAGWCPGCEPVPGSPNCDCYSQVCRAGPSQMFIGRIECWSGRWTWEACVPENNKWICTDEFQVLCERIEHCTPKYELPCGTGNGCLLSYSETTAWRYFEDTTCSCPW
ncbi:hypothetical protein RAS1_29380 [Phycisphaerae bacterium RAS1]|nr:hypothetical protein RAS1_29380 [Phycisphaerae bacterium RAS1]